MKMLDYVKLANVRLRENLAQSSELSKPLVDAYMEAGAPAIRIVACGSSRNACFCARDLMQSVLQVPIVVVTPEAYIKFDHAQPADAFDLFVSQSGYSTNTLAALDFCRAHGRRAVALTGNPTAPVADHADLVVDWGVGVESVDFVTVGVQTLVAFFMFFALHGARAARRIDDVRLERGLSDLATAIDAHQVALAASETYVASNLLSLSRKAPTMIVGAGPLFGVAMEACLKFNECLKRPAACHEPEEFVHGPEMQIDPGYQLFLLEDAQGDERLAVLSQTFARVCTTTLVTTLPQRREEGSLPFLLPAVPNPLMVAIPALVLFQWIAAQLMDALSCEDVHSFLAAQEDALAVKADGYADAVHALEAQAAERYGA